MPLSSRIFAGDEHMFVGSRSHAAWKRIETSSSFAVQESFPQLLILDKENLEVKFKENIVVRGNMMNGCKVF
jgi:hypothetical protein